MEKESHVQGAFYDVDHMDYRVSLNKETLDKVKQGNIIKSKIVYYSQNGIKDMVQKKLFITLLTDEERNKDMRETKFIRSDEKVCLKISNYLLNELITENPEDYEHRYDMMGNKIHFLVDDVEKPFSEKSGFDSTFRFCEKANKKQPTTGDLFESDYINVHNKPL